MVDHETSTPNDLAPTNDGSRVRNMPHGGRWALFAGISILGAPAVAIAPAPLTLPLAVASLACLVVAVVLLLLDEVRTRAAAREAAGRGHTAGARAGRTDRERKPAA